MKVPKYMKLSLFNQFTNFIEVALHFHTQQGPDQLEILEEPMFRDVQLHFLLLQMGLYPNADRIPLVTPHDYSHISTL